MKFYITTAIDYVNAKPHLGHAYEKIIADVLARWHMIKGNDVFFLTGTDENARKNSEAAKSLGVPVKEFVDENVKKFIELCKKLNVSNNDFIRTTEDRHIKVSQKIFQYVYDKGDIYKGNYEGLYCIGCEKFLTEKDLVDGKCPHHDKEPEFIKEESYFFRMSKYEKDIIKLLETKRFIVPENRRKEMLNRVKEEGLKDLCVSRVGMDWGIDVPFDRNHKIYVWFDALINYVSALGYPEGENFKYWPADIHVIGKDINWFHSVIWPSILLSAEIPVPNSILVHGFVNLKGKKMSKSSGLTVNPIEIVEKYSSDALRYFLIREIPLGHDGDFSEEALTERYNNELANNFGNFAQRTISFICKNFDDKVPEGSSSKVQETVKEKIEKSEKFWEESRLREGLEEILSISALGNEYFQKEEPWKTIKEDKEKAAHCLYNCANILKDLCILFYPVIPSSCEKLAEQLKIKIDWKNLGKNLKPGHEIGKPEILFRKIEKAEEANEEPKKPDETANKFSDLDLRVAEILEVSDHPNAEKLYLFKINCGEERQIVAGIKQWYSKEELRGKKIVVLANLEKAKLRGETSEAMLLAGEEKTEKGELVGLLFVEDSKPGEKVTVNGMEPNPKKEIKFKEFKEIKMKAGKDCVLYKNKKLVTKSGETVKVEKVKEGAGIC
ncbi:MAG: methionine--tRNA ligase [Candidatus Aenigmarchaeota archaeon]|nr:methionine--tRNA ligase [Candidatus Aenigmarchaeota archaeon]